MYINKPIKTYLDDLAAKLPAPGGGSAAGVVSAVGAALASMVCNYTVGKQKYAAFENRIEEILAQTETARIELLALADEDIEKYNALAEALKSKNNVERALKDACGVPYKICQICANQIMLARELLDKGNLNLVTDIAISAILLESAFVSSIYNIEINLKSIVDEQFKKATRDRIGSLRKNVENIKEEILSITDKKLEG